MKFLKLDLYILGALIPILGAGLVTMNSFTGESSLFTRQIIWTIIGFVIYFAYSRGNSHLGRGVVVVVDDIEGEEKMVPIQTPDN